MNFSKSKYCSFCQCPKILWLNKYKPETFVSDSSTQERMEKGNAVGDLAMQLFGDFVEVSAFDKDGNLDIAKMIENTNECLKNGTTNICEASFFVDGLYCAVDILHKEQDGYAIYEVKSSTHVSPVYITDVTYQKHVLEKCGIKVTGTFVVHINNEYVFDGKLDLQKFFTIKDVAHLVEEESKNHDIDADLITANKICDCEAEPDIDLSMNCREPYVCGYWDYCSRHLPKPNVFDVYRMSFGKKVEAYLSGYLEFGDVRKALKLNQLQKRQLDFVIKNIEEHIDKDGIKSFLQTLSYPLYFLDFETMQLTIPEFPNSKPYQQITFQYSLHYIETEGGEIKHKEFLGESGVDPRRALAEQLINDIPTNACVLAYNKGFECGRIRELAELFPDLSSSLLKIRDNVKDLIDPFHDGYYYNKAIGNSFSIKSVLPAMFPNDPELDYHNLEGVHNGGEAMNLFPKIKDLPLEEQAVARKNLLKYCELDTYAMVKIWQRLIEISK